MRGPCACPGGTTIHLGSVRQESRIPARTSTRPPHPPRPAPCPYRTPGATITLFNRQNSSGRGQPFFGHFPIRLSISRGGIDRDLQIDALDVRAGYVVYAKLLEDHVD